MPELTIAGNLLLGDEFVPGKLSISKGRIATVAAGHGSPGEISAPYVVPGLIDLQVNGGFGVDFGEHPEAIPSVARRLTESGVTSFLPTIISSPEERYGRIFDVIADQRHRPGARVLGLHLEGPFLSPQRAGAHPVECIETATDELFNNLLDTPWLRIMTLAPERPGAVERITRLRNRGVVVSLGHTNATYEQFIAGVDAGATMATHIFNAMSRLDSRAPGPVGAALVDDRVSVGLIADGIHLHPASVNLAIRCKTPERVALVTDMMAAAGMPPGEYSLGGAPVRVDATSARLADGRLAGSILTMDQAIRNVIAWSGVAPALAFQMASEIPARLLGLSDRGRIAPGLAADLVLLDENLRVQSTMIAGEFVWPRPPHG